MADFNTQYLGANSDRGPSPGLWGDCPVGTILIDPNQGALFFDDFMNAGATTAPYQYVGDASPVATGGDVDDDYGGVLRLTIENTDNNEAYVGTGNDTGTMVAIDTAANGGKKLWWEARVRSSYVTDWGFICGLGGAGITAANLITDNQTAIATAASFVGFRVLTADADGVDAVYLTASGAEAVAAEVAGTITAATWIKLGGKYDPATGYVDWYVNGSKVTQATQVLATTSGLPDGEGLLFVCGAKTGTSAAINLDIDWVRVGVQF